MKLPNSNYLTAQNKNLIQAGDYLAFLAGNTAKTILGGDPELEAAILKWREAQENLMGLAGR